MRQDVPTTPFDTLALRFHSDRLQRNPTSGTWLGLHEHDHRLEDYSLDAARDEAASLERFRTEFEAIAPATLTPVQTADRTWLLATIDGALQRLSGFRPLETDPDAYTSGLTASAFSIINREYAPLSVRDAALLSRLEAMPRALAEARTNLQSPPRVATEIALDQLDGNRELFARTIPELFAPLEDAELKGALEAACEAVLAAFDAYEIFLRDTVLPRSTGEFAIGAAAYRRKLAADELIDLPLDRVLAIGREDLARNQEALRAVALEIDPQASTQEVLDRLGDRHLAPEALLSTTQGMLDAILGFIRDRDMLTLPAGSPLRVIETPPFMRATTSAAMDTPGPFEAPGLSAYYYMTLPNPHWPASEQEAYMRQWTTPLIANLSVHEAYPGHYVQFLLTDRYPSLTRRMLYTPSNAEGWAHYCEQMMVEEGFHTGDPWYRVAQLMDALLRNARVVVGLLLHTGGMTVEEAVTFFEREAYLSHPLAKAEAWRGTMDPTYGYYTLGKLMVLKLREDYKRLKGDAYSLKTFHDEFLALGPLPLPLVRQAMLGEVGELL